MFDLEAGIIGSGESTVHLRSYIEKVARTDVSVLITGDTGTGKELVAKAIHHVSPRHDHPLVSINCAAIPDSLLESELFGHQKGAFTGAQASYLGKLRIAQGGTVFLDEIGDMSPYVQSKILRVLETREVFPLGASKISLLDVRFISATNQDLESLIAQKEFRKDLYYRLNVARIDLPSLSCRKDDIPTLLNHFIEEFSRRYQVHIPEARMELVACLQRYDWPGNIRELRNFVEGLFIDPPKGPIGVEDLPESFRSIFSQYVTNDPDEKDKLVSILRATNWNKSQAAARLNWSRMTLYRKMSKYRIDSSRSR